MIIFSIVKIYFIQMVATKNMWSVRLSGKPCTILRLKQQSFDDSITKEKVYPLMKSCCFKLRIVIACRLSEPITCYDGGRMDTTTYIQILKIP